MLIKCRVCGGVHTKQPFKDSSVRPGYCEKHRGTKTLVITSLTSIKHRIVLKRAKRSKF